MGWRWERSPHARPPNSSIRSVWHDAATRRAPYTVIGAWTGGHENTFRNRVEPIVHFLDVDLSSYALTQKRYAQLKRNSEKDTGEMLLEDSARNYRNVAFRLSASVAGALSVLPLVKSGG